MRLKYRPEIDGLRAIAVLSVILFHAGIPGFSGGFVGVDVFFVISGYLITGILLREFEAKSFSILTFYERRMRRILPALFLVLMACLPLGWFLMDPYAYGRLGQGMVAVVLFASNIFFWRTTDYFTATLENPLLHTWSLGVEEQFYIFFPLFLLVVWRYAKSWLWAAMLLAAIVSLAISEWGVQSGRALAAFYLIPSRAYELLLGSLVAHAAANGKIPRLSSRGAGFFAWLGLAAIACAVVVFNQGTPFPGYHALLPALGTALVLAFGSTGGVLGGFLSQRIVVGMGLVSYSAYLWHQPVYSFIHIAGVHPGVAVNLGIVLIILFMSWVSWRYVENPFRDRSFIHRRGVFYWAGGMSIVMVGCGAWLAITEGVSGRYTEREMEWWRYADVTLQSSYVTKRFDALSGNFEPDGRRKILVMGDSYAQDFVNMAYEAGAWRDAQIKTVYIPSTCQITYVEEDVSMHVLPADRPGCSQNTSIWSAMDLIEHADIIVLAASWRSWSAELLPDTISNMKLRREQRLFVVGPKNFGVVNVRRFLRLGEHGRASLRNQIHYATLEVNEILRRKIPSQMFVDQIRLVCGSDGHCPVVTDGDGLISYDGGHLTRDGAEYIGKKIFSESPLHDAR